MERDVSSFFYALFKTTNEQDIIDAYHDLKRNKSIEEIKDIFKLDVINYVLNKSYTADMKNVHKELSLHQRKKIATAIEYFLSIVITESIPLTDGLKKDDTGFYEKQAQDFSVLYSFLKYTPAFSVKPPQVDVLDIIQKNPKSSLFFNFTNIFALTLIEEHSVKDCSINYFDELLNYDYTVLNKRQYLQLTKKQKNQLIEKSLEQKDENSLDIRANFFKKVHNIDDFIHNPSNLTFKDSNDIVMMGWCIPKEMVSDCFKNKHNHPVATQKIINSLYAFYNNYTNEVLKEIRDSGQDHVEQLHSSLSLYGKADKADKKDTLNLAISYGKLGYFPSYSIPFKTNEEYFLKLFSVMIEEFPKGYVIGDINIFREGNVSLNMANIKNHFKEKLFYFLNQYSRLASPTEKALLSCNVDKKLLKFFQKDPFLTLELLESISKSNPVNFKNGSRGISTELIKTKIEEIISLMVEHFPEEDKDKAKYFLSKIGYHFSGDSKKYLEYDKEMLLFKTMNESGKSKKSILAKIEKDILLKTKKQQEYLESMSSKNIFKRQLI